VGPHSSCLAPGKEGFEAYFVDGFSAPKTTSTPPIVIIGPTSPVVSTVGNTTTGNVAPGNGAAASVPSAANGQQSTKGVENQQTFAVLPAQRDVNAHVFEDFRYELVLGSANRKKKARQIP
jgi:hypothetical protein